VDRRIVDWSSDAASRSGATSYRQLGISAIQTIAAALAVWVGLWALNNALPYVQNGAAAVTETKRQMAESRFLFEPTDRQRIYAFGDSKMLAGFQPRAFAAVLGEGTDAFNLAIPGDQRFVNLLESAIVAGNVPTHVFVEALPSQASVESWWGAFNDDNRIIQTLFPFRAFFRDAIVLVFEAGGLSDVVRRYRANANQIGRMRADHGYYFIRSQSLYPDNRLPNDYRLPTDRPNDGYSRRVDVDGEEFVRLVHLAERYDFEIVLVPVVYREGEFAPPPGADRELIAKLRRFNRIRILGPPYLLYEPSAFSDPVHLNTSGAERYTREIATLFRTMTTAGL